MLGNCDKCVKEWPGCGANEKLHFLFMRDGFKIEGCGSHFCARRDTVVVEEQPREDCHDKCALNGKACATCRGQEAFQPREELGKKTDMDVCDRHESCATYPSLPSCHEFRSSCREFKPREECDPRAEIAKCQSCRFIPEDGPCQFIGVCEHNSHYQPRPAPAASKAWPFGACGMCKHDSEPVEAKPCGNCHDGSEWVLADPAPVITNPEGPPVKLPPTWNQVNGVDFTTGKAAEDNDERQGRELSRLLTQVHDLMHGGCIPDKLAVARAIVAELPDETTPSARYIKELILPKVRRLREILG